MRNLKWVLLLLVMGGVISCKKDIGQNDQPAEIAEFPTTTAMKERVSLLKDVGKVLEEVYQDPKALYEVNATIFSEYYADESVLLKDLLFPETSPLYKQEAFTKSGAKAGIFKTRFYEALASGDFPFLKAALKGKRRDDGISGIEPRLGAAVPTDTAMEIFSNSSGVMIYFPYSENFGSNYGPAYFDNINTTPTGYKATIVSADREADSGPGQEPYICGTRDNQSLCYRAVTVNDAYAETKATHILGIGVEPNRLISDEPPPGTPINRVYHGWSRLTQQLDRLISFTGNGGGSDVKVSRISGYLQMADQQITTTTDDRISIHYKRKEIRKKRWKRVYGVWDADWKTNNTEQVYAAWEDDTQGTATFTGSLTTTATVPISGGGTVTGTRTLGFNVQVKTQDAIITQRKIDRNAYFRDAKNDQGWGYQMCDDKGCRYDNTFLPSGQNWPKFDEGTIWGYTWPYKTY